MEKLDIKVIGDSRENIARKILQEQHPRATILSERYLRDSKGVSVKDALNSRRRLDFVLIEDGKVIKVVEVTGPNVDKSVQVAKEMEIRGKGGTYVREPGKRGTNGLYDTSGATRERMNIDLDDPKYAKYK